MCVCVCVRSACPEGNLRCLCSSEAGFLMNGGWDEPCGAGRAALIDVMKVFGLGSHADCWGTTGTYLRLCAPA